MKKIDNIIIFALFFTILLASIISFAAENDLVICDHSYKYSTTTNGDFVYICSKCDGEITKTPSELETLWNNNVINQNPQDVEDGYFIDVVPDGVINSKDFAKIIHTKKCG
ncbi:MAG: hypothetical protein ACI4V4_00045 [Eubacterium sp.]